MSQLLPAALSLGIALSSTGAPLAKKDASHIPAKLTQSHLLAGSEEGRLPFAPEAEHQRIDGLFRVETRLAKQKRNAIRSATAAKRAIAGNVDLRGAVAASDAWNPARPQYGFYAMPHSDGEALTLLGSTDQIDAGFDNGQGVFYATYIKLVMGFMQLPVITTYDTETYTKLSGKTIQGDMSLMAADVDRDPTTGDVYGAFMRADGTGPVWGKGDYEACTSTQIGTFPAYPFAVACDKNGQYYTVCGDGYLYKVEKTTGEFTQVGPVDVPMERFSTGCVNNNNNTLVMSSYTNDGAGLYEIDLSSGETSFVATLPNREHIRALHIVAPLASPKAPDSPEMSLAMDDGSQDVTINLTMPTALFDGTPAPEATFGYKVLANGETVMEGEAAAGSGVSQTIHIEQAGMVEFVATTSNDDGVSPKTRIKRFIGKGIPEAPTDVVLSWADGTATLTWAAVGKSADGGYIDPAAVTYKVYDRDQQPVAENLTATTCGLSVPVPDTYVMLSYTVTACYDGKESAATSSNQVGIGACLAPFTLDMRDRGNFDLHTVVDANNDGKTWNYGSGRTRYPYSTRENGDDWLFSPTVKLEGGKTYEFKALVGSHNSTTPERIEVLYGDSPAIDAMTQSVVPPTVVLTGSGQSQEIKGVIKPQTTGNYTIGFHALSDVYSNYMYLFSYEVGTPLPATAPDAVVSLEVEAHPYGDLQASVSFSMPEVSLGGDPLQGDVTVEIWRGEVSLGAITGAPGSAQTFEDTSVPERGDYTYTFVPFNTSSEQGLPVSKTLFVGPKAAAAVDKDNVSLKETSPGVFVLQWEAVTTDVEGTVLPASNITYDVFAVSAGESGLELGEKLNDAPLTVATYTHATDPVEAQHMVYYAVMASNRGVAGEAAVVSMLAGADYQLPVRLSSLADLADHVIFYGGDGTIGFGTSQTGYEAQDGDDSFIIFQNQYQGDITYLQTGKIAVSGDNPVISFYLMPLEADDENETAVYVEADGETTPLLVARHSECVPGEWNKIKAQLADYSGKTIRILIAAQSVNVRYTAIDNLKVFDELDFDVSARMSAPAKVETGTEFSIMVAVTNEGAQDAGRLSVELLRDGDVVDTRELAYGIAADEAEQVIFRQTVGIADRETVSYRAVVNYADDQRLSNNATETVAVTRALSMLPTVSGLDGTQTAGGNQLSWEAVDLSKEYPVRKTDTFEDAEPWAHELEPWIFVDVDDSPVNGLSGITIPGIETRVTKSSFFVFDCSGEQFNASFDAHSGVRYLASLVRGDDGQVDDWAISPLLSGESQSVSFWAKSYHPSYAEKIEVYYSMGGTEPGDFVMVEALGTKVVPSTWTEYTVNLPEGTRHFAIRSCAVGAFILMVDDISYTTMGMVDATLTGYNVYCDGIKLNESPLAEAAYTHAGATDEDHTYQVSAVYDKGESELSSPLTLAKSGIGQTWGSALKVTVEGKAIVVTGTLGDRVVINGVDGRTVHAAGGDTRVMLPQGVYLVTVGRKTSKVIVR